jgi:hypothetical protein
LKKTRWEKMSRLGKAKRKGWRAQWRYDQRWTTEPASGAIISILCKKLSVRVNWCPAGWRKREKKKKNREGNARTHSSALYTTFTHVT